MIKLRKAGSNRVTESQSPSDKVTESHTGVDMAIKGAGYTVDNLRKVMSNENLISEARRSEDERVRILAYNDGWTRGFLHGLAIGIGIFTVGALYVLWSIMP